MSAPKNPKIEQDFKDISFFYSIKNDFLRQKELSRNA